MLSLLKPYLSILGLPPVPLFLLIFIGLFIIEKSRRFGRYLILIGVLTLWLISCGLFSAWLEAICLESFTITNPTELKRKGVQAIVVLGAGVELDLPDGKPQLQAGALDRLRYAIQLSRESKIPILVSGGKGWASRSDSISESDITEIVSLTAFDYPIKWKEGESRDTKEASVNSFEILSKAEIKNIALVTHSWHMSRSYKNFEKAGFIVTPAPMGQNSNNNNLFFSLFPSAGGLQKTQIVIHEFMGNLLSQ
jgi:uncharacterized SAM-binding protein YcdF (DUF218 family)